MCEKKEKEKQPLKAYRSEVNERKAHKENQSKEENVPFRRRKKEERKQMPARIEMRKKEKFMITGFLLDFFLFFF